MASDAPHTIPATVPEEDVPLLENILTALRNLATTETPLCSKYKIDVAPTFYLVRAVLPLSDPFEIQLADLLFLQSISPARIEHIAIARSSSLELVIRVLDCKQRIAVTSTVVFHNNVCATRKRKWLALSSS
jgi:hypothetical protein